jgi:hypothetical protein
MKNVLIAALLAIVSLNAFTQTAITAVNTSINTAASSFTYSNAGTTYNWGLSPNNSEVFVNGFTAGGAGYSYASLLTGNVKLRRVNNALTTGNYSLVWAEVVNAGAVYNMLPAYQNDMEQFFNNRAYNKGTDNFFDNTSANSNNIERLDWILNSSYTTATPAQVGFAVFERGAAAAHDPFCIAAITSLDGLGNPATYSNIVRVVATNYGDPGPNVIYRILKAAFPSNLLDAGTNTQNRGGLIVSLQSLGVTAGQLIYGYSLFSNDLPIGATPVNLIDFTNTTYFPINTGAPGGIDLVAVTGIYIENSVLPVRFLNFSAADYQNNINLKWDIENEISVDRYDIERSEDGISFTKTGTINVTANAGNAKSYTFIDNSFTQFTNLIYYRIKQVDLDGKYLFSKTLVLKRNTKKTGMIIFPNPIASNLSINVHSSIKQNAVLGIYNTTGSLLQTENLNLQAGNNSLSFDKIERLTKGIYFIKIRFASGQDFTERFIK